MVEKRTIAFITLATLVWASMATGFMTYYYLEQTRYLDQIDEKQQLLNELTENYDESITKRNLLSGDYGASVGEYQWFSGEDYSSLMEVYEKLISNLHGNYTLTLNKFPELNATYNNLCNEFQTLNEKSTVTKEEFGSLLNDFYKLLTMLAMKELEEALGKIGVIEVSISIDYGNSTIKWYNVSTSPGTTLFDLTRKIAEIEYSYWPAMEPGHILVTSINNYEEGYWIWYYRDEETSEWTFGPVGCDACILKNNGIYKWSCSS
ncbi:MAG: hypothetical protein OEY95_05015 [Candidatus Bathyarchaeota archaeon]|nr:hypothetical protein [Candidatus Bathyarchaeota archaeon]MDH5754544.1 hypothetical protein [Candidatus Bathyarchaeota archaeon]